MGKKHAKSKTKSGINDTRVFVYGTLKEGHSNHGALENSESLGRCFIEGKFRLVDLGFYPAVLDDESVESTRKIFGEVYKITDETLYHLDLIEGHPTYYIRRKIKTPFGNAWVYFLPSAYKDRPFLEEGVWEPSDEEKKYVSENAA